MLRAPASNLDSRSAQREQRPNPERRFPEPCNPFDPFGETVVSGSDQRRNGVGVAPGGSR